MPHLRLRRSGACLATFRGDGSKRNLKLSMNLFWNSIISPTAYGGGASRNLTEWKGSWIWRRLRRFIGRYGRSGRWRSRRWLDRGGARKRLARKSLNQEKIKAGKYTPHKSSDQKS